MLHKRLRIQWVEALLCIWFLTSVAWYLAQFRGLFLDIVVPSLRILWR
jgi:uncharacterized membrane protein